MPISNYSRSMYLSAVGNLRLRNAIKAASPNMNGSYDLVGVAATNATFVPISNLAIGVVANKFYTIEGFIPVTVTATATNGINLNFNGGTCAVSNMIATTEFTIHSGTAPLTFDSTALNTTVTGGTATAWTKVWIYMSFMCTQSGLFIPQIASTGAGGSPPSANAGSWITAYPLDHVIEE